MDRIMRDVIQKIDKVREEKKVNAKDLSLLLGYTKTWWSSLKSQEKELKVSDFVKIAQILEISPAEMLLTKNDSFVDLSNLNMIDLIRQICCKEIERYLHDDICCDRCPNNHK